MKSNEENMQEYNIYPSNSSHFIPTEPTEQREEREEEAKRIADQLPLVERLIEHMKGRVDFYGSIDSITFDVLKNPNEHMHTVLGYKIAKESLEQELNLLMTEIAEFKK